MASGAGENEGEVESSMSELIGGREPKRFQVMAKIDNFYGPDWRMFLVFCSDYYFNI